MLVLPISLSIPRFLNSAYGICCPTGTSARSVTDSISATTFHWPERVQVIPVDQLGVVEDTMPLNAVQHPADLAYVIYTSGSTGEPKGVMIDHRSALNTIADINRRFAVGPSDRILALSSLSFDLLGLPFVRGARRRWHGGGSRARIGARSAALAGLDASGTDHHLELGSGSDGDVRGSCLGRPARPAFEPSPGDAQRRLDSCQPSRAHSRPGPASEDPQPRGCDGSLHLVDRLRDRSC